MKTVESNSTANAISLLVATPGLLLLPVAVLEGNWADARHAGLWVMLGFAMWVVFRQCGDEAKALDDACEEIESLNAEVLRLRAALEEQWLIAHDEHCTNMRDCASFGGLKPCRHTRP